ncbi:glycosyltransferase family 4 protein [Hyunsoonleella ulvae]|uniref:glycosyltransferase family 4 protein n=1 Tax=Hyunsoonleella ulvae TaxID=2799948 RepID=UPI0019393385|nr:glycosyltransferase family 4 protein [Hyunsoonleella ulvae]
MTKLLFITNNISGPGGLERVLALKSNYLINNLNYEVHILTLSQAKNESPFYDFNEGILFHKIKINTNPIFYFSSYLSNLKNKIKEIKPDLISFCDDGIKGILAPVFLKIKCPLIYERHASKRIHVESKTGNILKKVKLKLLNLLLDYGAKKFDKVVLLTNGNKNEWKINNSIVIPNVLSFFPETTSNLQSRNVIAVGHHNHNKGFDRLLKSWKIVISKHSNWRLNVFGNNGQNMTYINMAKQLELNSSVTFYKAVKNIKEKYLESSIYVMPSRSEGFGMTIIEAQSCGLPCISYDCPSGPKDLIHSGKDGFLIENGDIESFAEKIILLIENLNLRFEMGKKSREGSKKFLAENIMKEWDNLFKSLIKGNHAY